MANEYLEEVMEKLTSGPTSQDLDFFLEAYARIGYLVSVAQGRRDLAIAERKYAQATAYAQAKRDGAKTSADAEAAAVIGIRDVTLVEVRAGEAYTKLQNLLDAVEQAINGIKYIGKQTDAPMTLPRR